jgi:hypothetical protein
MSVLIDSYSEENANNLQNLTNTSIKWAYGFTGNSDYKIGSAVFSLKKVSSPTGDIYVELRNSSRDTVLATSEVKDVSTLPEDYELITFGFSGDQQYQLSDTTYYITLCSDNIPSFSYVYFEVDSTGGDGMWLYRYDTEWHPSTYDMCYYVYAADPPTPTPEVGVKYPLPAFTNV